jgi:uncharacterized protein YciI
MTRRWLLFYDYVDGIAEKRAPHREAHLEHIAGFPGMLIAGAVGDPPHSGLFVFESDERIDEFVHADPYHQAGLVTAFRVEPWSVVTGA